MLREDYLLKLIREAADAIARAFGMVEEKQLDEAEREIGEAWRRLLKMPRDLFLLDERTVSESLGEASTVRVAARACVAEAKLFEARGKSAKGHYLRALSLYRHVGIGDDPADVEAERAAKTALGDG